MPAALENMIDEANAGSIRAGVVLELANGPVTPEADAILARMLAHPKVKAARVSTEKPDVYPDCDAVGVEVFGIKES